MMRSPSWNDLHQRDASGPVPTAAAESFDEICAAVLTGSAGERLLAALRARYIEASENPLGSAESLRVRASQAQLVRELEAARDRGIAAAAARRKTS